MINQESREPQFEDINPEQVRPEGGLSRDIPGEPQPDFGPKTLPNAKEAERLAEIAKWNTRKEAILKNYKDAIKNPEEKPKSKELTFEQRTARINKLMDIYAEEKIKQGLPVAKGIAKTGKELRFVGGRINMNEYRNAIGFGRYVVGADTAEAIRCARSASKKDKKRSTINQTPQKDTMIPSELQELSSQAEKLAVLLFAKFFDDFIINTSIYDDAANHTDLFMVDGSKESIGIPLMAFDVVVGENNFADKRSKVKGINTKGGTAVKYGLVPNTNPLTKANKKIIQGSIYNMPVLAVCLSHEAVKELGNNFEFGKKTPFEIRKMKDICNDLLAQINNSKNEVKNASCSQKLEAFEARLRSLILKLETQEPSVK